jgi:hypothetical protein
MVQNAWGVSRAALVAAMVLGCLVGAASAVTPTTSGGGFLSYDDVKGEPYDVQFDGRSFYLSGERTIFLSGSVHPPRIPVGEWNRTLQTLKSNGLNMVQIYVFWNVHEPDAPGATDWDVVNLDDFVRLAADLGLFVNLRVGPYVCAEWKFGGLPLWLFNRTAYPTLTLRTDDPVWMDLMGDWFQRVVDSLAHHLAPLGGPIAMVQVENELAYDAPPEYVRWAGRLAETAVAAAVAKARGDPPQKHPKPVAVPVLMCEGSVAPNAIAACNGPTCAEFLEDMSSHDAILEETDEGVDAKRVLVDFPGVWTEIEGGYQTWGGSPDHPTAYFWGRGADDAARAAMAWFARGGAHANYYMFAGGNNFGRTEGDAITTAYATDVNVCPDGLPNEPKFTHLGNMHAALASAAKILLDDDPQANAAVPLAHRPAFVGDEDGDGMWDGPPEEDEDGASMGEMETQTDSDTGRGARRSSTIATRRASRRGRRASGRLSRRVGSGGEGSSRPPTALSRGGDARGRARGRARARANVGDDEGGSLVVAYVYRSSDGSEFAAFLENNGDSDVVADFQGGSFRLNERSSALVLGDEAAASRGEESIRVAFNSSDVPLVSALRAVTASDRVEGWRRWKEPTKYRADRESRRLPSVTKSHPAPQVEITGDATEYMWYHAEFELPETTYPVALTLKMVGRLANHYSVFVDGEFKGSASDETHSPERQNQVVSHAVDLGFVGGVGRHAVSILSESLGVSNFPVFPGDRPYDFEKGLVWAAVTREDGEEATLVDIEGAAPGDRWRMRPGLYGETIGLPEDDGDVTWGWLPPGNPEVPPATWLRAEFAAPDEYDPDAGDALLLDASRLGRGRAWINGHDLGRYWNVARNDDSGAATQSLYYVPGEWLTGGTNVIVLVEMGGVANLQASFAVARMTQATKEEAEEAAKATSGGNQRSCRM